MLAPSGCCCVCGVRFLLQLMVILVLCKLLGALLSYVKQVQVIGEILAGIVVGPTVLGQWGWWSTHIFPTASVSPASNNYITLAADVGIVLFMFYVGLDLNESLVRKQWKRAMPVAVAAIAFPFSLGIGLGAWLFDVNNSLLAVPVDRTAFYLFLGSSMSFTALPVLASLLSATNLIATPIGTAPPTHVTPHRALACIDPSHSHCVCVVPSQACRPSRPPRWTTCWRGVCWPSVPRSPGETPVRVV